MHKTVIGTFVGLLILAHVHATADAASDQELERRVAHLAEQLRCLVCQNQSLADSHAALAVDLRNQVREQLANGSSEAEVLDFMTGRYGDFVLYRPPVKASTWLLWFGPLLLLLAAIASFLFGVTRWRREQEKSLSQQERQAAAELLAPDAKERL